MSFKYFCSLSSDRIEGEFYYSKPQTENKNQLLYIIKEKEVLLKVAIQVESLHN